MPKLILEKWKALDDIQRREVRTRLHDSPLALRLLDMCIEQEAPQHHRNIVQALYGTDDALSYARAENRFFKLRAKLVACITDATKGSPDTDMKLPDEQLRYEDVQYLTRKGRWQEAAKVNKELDKVCRDKQIFELLPQIIETSIFINQQVNNLNANKALYIRLKEAIAHQAAIRTMNMLARKVYDINFKRGIVHAKPELAEMRDIASRYPDHTRFAACYHYVSAYYKLSSHVYEPRSNAISRHMNALTALGESIYRMPLINYTFRYDIINMYHLSQIREFYYLHTMQFDKMLEAENMLWELSTDPQRKYRIPLHGTTYINRITALILNGMYKPAAQVAEDFIRYALKRKSDDDILLAKSEQIRVQLWLFAAAVEQEQHLKVFLRYAQGENKGHLYAAVYALIRFYLAAHRYKDASKILNHPDTAALFTVADIYQIYIDFIETFAKRGDKSAAILLFRQRIKKAKLLCTAPEPLMQVRWLELALDRV